ncbi:uncharacterized protein LOC123010686 [Tribolium madens]|uniref:uncharacterized protein LOC123010686 n=1 Tax=Tribolium madens TaxID=41895 RepID=UPI001CF75C61|nr:uncharacterized protein LOC123010686 [Tribolium madens]XP_044263693.1 uncharacterized protein LOC123010686 [Tribolium madens]
MNESQKPFACTIGGCEMTFTNEDHLNWHHKKHDMVLNLGLASKNAEVADQTPTPTRFIRNCEEVGLFQDLQNVNPFDETFKKAIESAKSGTLHLPEAASNDDTLHTPHILLNLESSNEKYSDNRNDVQLTHFSVNDICISRVETVSESPTPSENDLTITIEKLSPKKEKDKQINLKDKLKETIQKKGKSSGVTITPIPLEKLQESQKRTPISEKDDSSNVGKKQKTDKDDEKEKIREINRAAQIRCRKRKKIQSKKMEEELKTLKSENSKLYSENQDFKHKIYALKELLVKHKKENTADNTTIVKNLEEILNSAPIARKETPSENAKRKPIKPPIVPVPLVQHTAQILQKPLIIQYVAPVAHLALPVPNK